MKIFSIYSICESNTFGRRYDAWEEKYMYETEKQNEKEAIEEYTGLKITSTEKIAYGYSDKRNMYTMSNGARYILSDDTAYHAEG